MSKLGLLILVKPTALQKQAALFNLIASLLGSLPFQLQSLPREKGNLNHRGINAYSRSTELSSLLSGSHPRLCWGSGEVGGGRSSGTRGCTSAAEAPVSPGQGPCMWPSGCLPSRAEGAGAFAEWGWGRPSCLASRRPSSTSSLSQTPFVTEPLWIPLPAADKKKTVTPKPRVW